MTTYGKSKLIKRQRIGARRVNRRVGGEKTAKTAARRRPSLLATKRVMKVVGVLALAVLTAVGVYHVGRLAVGGERLRVARVEIVGNERASRRELDAYIGIKLGQSLLELDLDVIALRLRHHPWVASASVRRRLPDQVVIEVREHLPAAIVSLGAVYLADAEGRLFKRLDSGDRVALPVITGLSREEVGQRTSESAARVREGIELTTIVASMARGSRLHEVHFDADLGWSVVLGPERGDGATARLYLGDQPGSRLPLALAAMARAREAGGVPAVVFADNKKSPERVQVRLRQPAGSQPTLVATAN